MIMKIKNTGKSLLSSSLVSHPVLPIAFPLFNIAPFVTPLL
jgi:hypothetical protein